MSLTFHLQADFKMDGTDIDECFARLALHFLRLATGLDADRDETCWVGEFKIIKIEQAAS